MTYSVNAILDPEITKSEGSADITFVQLRPKKRKEDEPAPTQPQAIVVPGSQVYLTVPLTMLPYITAKLMQLQRQAEELGFITQTAPIPLNGQARPAAERPVERVTGDTGIDWS